MNFRFVVLIVALLMASGNSAMAQSAAGFVEPNAETNQIPSPSNTEPANPSAGSYSEARTPTSPDKKSDRDAPGRFDIGPTETYGPPAYAPPPLYGE